MSSGYYGVNPASSSEGAGVALVELSRLSVVKLDWVDQLNVLVSWGSVQAQVAEV